MELTETKFSEVTTAYFFPDSKIGSNHEHVPRGGNAVSRGVHVGPRSISTTTGGPFVSVLFPISLTICTTRHLLFPSTFFAITFLHDTPLTSLLRSESANSCLKELL